MGEYKIITEHRKTITVSIQILEYEGIHITDLYALEYNINVDKKIINDAIGSLILDRQVIERDGCLYLTDHGRGHAKQSLYIAIKNGEIIQL